MGKGMDVGKKEQITGRKKERIAETKNIGQCLKNVKRGIKGKW